MEAADLERPPAGVTVLRHRDGAAAKVAVEWSDAAPVLIGRALRVPSVTALRITAPEGGEDDHLYWEDDRDEDGEPTPATTVETGALATLDLGGLTELDLSYLRIGALGAKTLAVSAYLRAEAADLGTAAGGHPLETLDLRYCGIGNTGLAALAAAPLFNGVRRLRLQNNAITEKGTPALHRFTGLTDLDLRYNEIGVDGVRALLAAPFVPSLTRLLLYRSDVGDEGAALLAQAPQLPPALRSFWRSV
ncbi:hypothetical protein [Actinomadura welshii]|uniref:hypothetical protein n=1 Tax=Actinomadura welshii TaxID=3103817 RepID=UPI000421389B|nr:hypothetical protein [Actinomadura madurae]